MKLRAFAVAILCCPILFAWPALLAAEEILEKSSGRFLGWQKSTTEFITCEKSLLKIEPGRVVKTMTKCGGPVFALTGRQTYEVTSLDADKRLVAVKDSKGESLSLFYPSILENEPKALKFEWLKPGQKIDADVLRDKAGDVLRVESMVSKTMAPESVVPRLNPR